MHVYIYIITWIKRIYRYLRFYIIVLFVQYEGTYFTIEGFFEILRSSNILFSKSDFDMIRIIWTSNLIFMIQIYWYI